MLSVRLILASLRGCDNILGSYAFIGKSRTIGFTIREVGISNLKRLRRILFISR